jgi:hypothetical protein
MGRGVGEAGSWLESTPDVVPLVKSGLVVERWLEAVAVGAEEQRSEGGECKTRPLPTVGHPSQKPLLCPSHSTSLAESRSSAMGC